MYEGEKVVSVLILNTMSETGDEVMRLQEEICKKEKKSETETKYCNRRRKRTGFSIR